MKQRNYLTRLASASAAALSVLLLAASCSTDDYAAPGTDAPDGQIRFEISFAPRDGAVQTHGPATRVTTDTQFNSTWQDGDAIGIFAVAHGFPISAADNPIHNVKLTYSSANSNWTPEEPLYWPAGTGSYDFYAYYPYDAAVTDPTQLTFIAKADQSAKDAATGRSHFNLSDLLRATANNEGKGFTRGDDVRLSFVHAMTLVEVKVSKVTLQGDYNPDDLTVWLNGCSTTQTLNLADGSLSNPSVPESIRMYPCPNDEGTSIYSYRALVAAGTIVPAGTSLFRFCYRDKEVLASPPLKEQLTLTSGCAETFSIAFPHTLVTVMPTERIADLIPEAERAKVTRLYVTGEMTADDFAFIKNQLPNITALDLSQATVKGNKIPDFALANKNGLQEFIFPAGITAIGNSAFFSCLGLTGSLTIPEGVETIADDAFFACDGFTGSLNLPKSVKTIGWAAFNKCLNFTGSLTIPEGVTSIGGNAFSECMGFNGSLTIPKSVTSIGRDAFYRCSNITSITCHIADPGNVSFGDNIGTDVFDLMNSVTAVYVPAAAVDVYKAHPSWSLFANIIQPIPNNN